LPLLKFQPSYFLLNPPRNLRNKEGMYFINRFRSPCLPEMAFNPRCQIAGTTQNSCKKYSVLTQSNLMQPVSCDPCCFLVMASVSHWSRSASSCAVGRVIIPVTWSNRNNFGATMGKPHSYTAETSNDLTCTQLSSSSFSIEPNQRHRHVTSHRTQQIKSLWHSEPRYINKHTHTQTHTHKTNTHTHKHIHTKQTHTHTPIIQFDGRY